MAVGPVTADCFDTLLEQADYAMGAAKAAGHSQIAFYRMFRKARGYTPRMRIPNQDQSNGYNAISRFILMNP